MKGVVYVFFVYKILENSKIVLIDYFLEEMYN